MTADIVDAYTALSILDAWKKDASHEEVPWHITDLGWSIYANHPSAEVRSAALNHPYYGCPESELQRHRDDFRRTAQAYT